MKYPYIRQEEPLKELDIPVTEKDSQTTMKYVYSCIINEDGTPLEVEVTPEKHAEMTKQHKENVQFLRDYCAEWGEKLKTAGLV